ncbi:AMP-dependent synthetase/ligase [Tanacetum coccineum]
MECKETESELFVKSGNGNGESDFNSLSILLILSKRRRNLSRIKEYQVVVVDEQQSLENDGGMRRLISLGPGVHLGDFSRIIVGFYSINGLKSGKVEVHDNAVVGSQSILLPGSVVNNDVILGVLLVAPIHSVIKRGGVYMVKSRYSHRIGVNGKGVLNIYDDIKGLPNHKIFHLCTRFKSYLEIFTPIPSLLSDVAGQDHMPVALKMKWKLLCS